jgi:sarcosine oxidase subunit gamma
MKRRSPLEGFDLPAGLRELPFLAQIDVRVEASSSAMQRLATALDFVLPLEPNTVTGKVDHYALWLGPDEWLIVGPEGTEAVLEARCRSALGSDFGSVVDVSANRTTLELHGPNARVVLETGCAIDLHPRAFGPGRCAQTLVARTAVVLHQTTGEPRYRLLVRPSYAAFLATWFCDAMGALSPD